MLPSVSTKILSETLETALGRLRGHRALLIGTETDDVASRLRKRFEKIEIATGTRASARLHPREIFRQATHHNAVAFILCHNHPSGHPTPSPEDIKLTRRLVQAGKAMGIELLDHIIVTDNQWTSFRNSHLL